MKDAFENWAAPQEFMYASGMEAEVERLRKDAERYRWLRDDNALHAGEGAGFSVCLEVRDGDTVENDAWVGIDLDLAIDAAMTETK